MKIWKMVFSSLSFLLACQFSQAQASEHASPPNTTTLPIYYNAIAEISLGYKDAMLVGDFTLGNGLIMHIVDYKTRDDNVMNTWQAGDIVDFKVYAKKEALILTAKRVNVPDPDAVEPYVICDVVNSSRPGLMIEEIIEEGRFVKLNDGSLWEFTSGWFSSLPTASWKVGERVMVSGPGDTNSYNFINVDAPIAEDVASATGSFVTNE